MWGHSRPFKAKVQTIDALLYEENIGPIRLFGLDKRGRPSSITCIKKPIKNLMVYHEGSVRMEKESPIEIIEQEMIAGLTTS